MKIQKQRKSTYIPNSKDPDQKMNNEDSDNDNKDEDKNDEDKSMGLKHYNLANLEFVFLFHYLRFCFPLNC